MLSLELNLSIEEINLIIDFLENSISELSMEITDTDKMEYREKLKNKRNALQKLLKSLYKNTAIN